MCTAMSCPLVLLVEDDEDSRTSMKEVLEADGYAVDIATDGEHALRRLKASPPPALILLDMRMPGMDGETLVRTLKDDSGHLPIDIVILTALAPRTQGLYLPTLRKPIDLETLLQVVGEHTGRRTLRPSMPAILEDP